MKTAASILYVALFIITGIGIHTGEYGIALTLFVIGLAVMVFAEECKK